MADLHAYMCMCSPGTYSICTLAACNCTFLNTDHSVYYLLTTYLLSKVFHTEDRRHLNSLIRICRLRCGCCDLRMDMGSSGKGAKHWRTESVLCACSAQFSTSVFCFLVLTAPHTVTYKCSTASFLIMRMLHLHQQLFWLPTNLMY